MKTWKPFLFWLLSCTWGIVTTAIGALISLTLLLTLHRPHIFGWCICFEAGSHWGGCSFGPFFLTQHGASDRLKCHEHGHSLQNCAFGPLMPFLVNLPSTLRYHYRNIQSRLHPKKKLPPYDAIWFEAQATKLGMHFFYLPVQPREESPFTPANAEELPKNCASLTESDE